MKKLSFLIVLLMLSTIVFAQPANTVEMADAMHSSGKIYVVIATILVIFTGLAIYLFSMDRRIKKIEKGN